MEDGDYVVKVNHPIFSSNDFRNDYYKYFLYGNLCERKYYEIETDLKFDNCIKLKTHKPFIYKGMRVFFGF